MRLIRCREADRCSKRERCPHAVPHQDRGPECWPNGSLCPGCSDGTEPPPDEFRQKKGRGLSGDELVLWPHRTKGKTFFPDYP